MYTLILTLHILISLSLMIVVLVQSGKGGGMGGVFGGGSEALFSAPSGSAFIKKVTAGLAIGFFCTTLFLTVLESRKGGRSVIERMGVPQQQQ